MSEKPENAQTKVGTNGFSKKYLTKNSPEEKNDIKSIEEETTTTTSVEENAVNVLENDLTPEFIYSQIHLHLLEPRLQNIIKDWISSGQVCPLNLIRSMTPLSLMRSLSIPSTLIEQWQLFINLLTSRRHLRRQRLDSVVKLHDVTQALRNAKRILVVTGAGISVSAGIPDFRSPTGIYAQLATRFPTLTHPTDMFTLDFFRKDPRPFYHFAKDIYPGPYQPTITHKFIKLLEDKHKLLRNYSQNIDSLEQKAGVTKILQCHGGFDSATCLNCHAKVCGTSLKPFIESQTVAICNACSPSPLPPSPLHSPHQQTDSLGATVVDCVSKNLDEIYHPPLNILKPDITFFGEDLSPEFYSSLQYDLDETDLLLVIGTSLKVGPVNMIPEDLAENVPQILINREPLERYNFDVELLGDCDTIVQCLCETLGWIDALPPINSIPSVSTTTCPSSPLKQSPRLPTPPPASSTPPVPPVCVPSSNVRESSPTLSDKSAHFINDTVRCHRIKPRVYAFPGAIIEPERNEWSEEDDGEDNDDDSNVSSTSSTTESSVSGGSDSKIIFDWQRNRVNCEDRRRTRSESEVVEMTMCTSPKRLKLNAVEGEISSPLVECD